MIILFGTGGCKYCNILKENIQKTLGDDDLLYLDLLDDEEAINIAKKIKDETYYSICMRRR